MKNLNLNLKKSTASVSRSKSDAGNRILKTMKSKDEIERFFETLGLDTSVWDSINGTSDSLSTPAHCIDDNTNYSNFTISIPTSSSSSSSSSSSNVSSKSDLSSPSPSLSNGSTKSKCSIDQHQVNHYPKLAKSNLQLSKSCQSFVSRETSIVEKNARVIKWLYNCKKACQS